MDPRGAALEEHVGEPARRCANIDRDAAADVDRERVQRARELVAAARDVPASRIDRDLRPVADRRRRAIGARAVHAYDAGEDECLRALPARREPALDEELIEPDALRPPRLPLGAADARRRQRTTHLSCRPACYG